MTEAAAPIQIWPFQEAPEWMRLKSPHGGDEDWVIYAEEWINYAENWVVEGIVDRLTVCDASKHFTDDGVFWITCHA